MTYRSLKIGIMLGISLSTMTSSMAAIEINEDDFGPSYEILINTNDKVVVLSQ